MLGNHEPNASRVILLTTYLTGATAGKNLGMPGYSYDFVARIFTPLFARWGEVMTFRPTSQESLEAEVSRWLAAGHEVVHVSFLPFQDTYLSKQVPNVVVPAWEYPDTPDHEFDGNRRNNWVEMGNKCDLVIVGPTFSQKVFQKDGIHTPIHIVPVPVKQELFSIPAWRPGQSIRIESPAHVFHGHEAKKAVSAEEAVAELFETPRSLKARTKHAIKQLLRLGYRATLRPFLTETHRKMLAHAVQAIRQVRAECKSVLDQVAEYRQDYVNLEGIVYTYLFNPADSRKNWDDLLTAFIYELGDCPDATLVFKLVTRSPEMVSRVIQRYRSLGRPHRCRFVVMSEYLSDAQMQQLTQATTYYATTTRAEGNCLPLMDFLAAGRPAVSPWHSSLTDYFGPAQGYVIESHPEPAAWPHDNLLRLTTTWHRMVWPSITKCLRESYQTVRENLSVYQAKSLEARRRLQEWASHTVVQQRLDNAIKGLLESRSSHMVEKLPSAA